MDRILAEIDKLKSHNEFFKDVANDWIHTHIHKRNPYDLSFDFNLQSLIAECVFLNKNEPQREAILLFAT